MHRRVGIDALHKGRLSSMLTETRFLTVSWSKPWLLLGVESRAHLNLRLLPSNSSSSISTISPKPARAPYPYEDQIKAPPIAKPTRVDYASDARQYRLIKPPKRARTTIRF